MKKRLTAVCAVIMIIIVCASCGSTTASRKEAIEHFDFNSLKDYFWVAEETYDKISHVKICGFTNEYLLHYDISYDSNYTLTEALEGMLKQAKKLYPDTDFNKITALLTADGIDGIVCTILPVTIDKENAKIIGGNENMIFNYQYSANIEVLKCHGDTYKKSSTISTVENAYDQAKCRISDDEKQEFLSKYQNAISSREAQYDPIGNLNKNFIITGVASLDDYYNYEYRDFNVIYFCIEITPQGGNYSNQWHIYADRNTFRDLYNALLNGDRAVSLICRLEFYKASQNMLGTLVDCYIE